MLCAAGACVLHTLTAQIQWKFSTGPYLNYFILSEVTLLRRGWPDPNGLVRHRDVSGSNIGIGVDSDSLDPEFLRRADDATSDFATIGDQHLEQINVSMNCNA